MSQFKNVDEILNFAIQGEQNAVDLYTDLAGTVKSEAMKKTFLEYANEERGHKAKLENVKGGKKLISAEQKIQDLKIADYTVDVVLDDNPSYQDVLLFAMKLEKTAFRLYMDLAATIDDAGLKETMIGLANEEAKHKLKFEIEYDDHVLVEN
jgi:rubrerythrin